ncbi:MAG: tetratricopeptide repeat protein [Bacteroidota bacterium]
MKIIPLLYLNFLFILLFVTSCKTDSNNYNHIENSKTAHHIDGYVGDESCNSCHEKEFDTWRGSHHDLAMQIVNSQTILGNFDDHKITIDSVDYHFYKKDSSFYVNIKDIDNTIKDYKIDYVFGVTPLQQYIISFEKGKKQVLRVTWDTVEKKWFHQYAGDIIVTNDWLHWSRGGQNWNTMCAECHSTNLKKNYIVEKDSFHTTYSVINVSCESCHGPAEKHNEWANKNGKTGNMHILNSIDQTSQINECAPCHSRRVKLTKNLTPGLAYEEQYMIQTLTTNYYYPDGQIREEDYVVGSFLQSKMFSEGIKCSDCHDPHSMQLKFEGNKLCHQCHVPTVYDSPDHHFHEQNTEASQCINCHMTGRFYMGNDFRRDHSFRIPRPDQSILYDTPNACKGCHDDESNKWAADQIIKWYGPTRRDHFSDAMLLSSKNNLTNEEKEKLNAFILDVKYPYLTRATAIENMVITSNKDYEIILQSLADSSALIRFKALQKFNNIPLQERVVIGLKHINDSSKLVRIGAAQLMVELDINTISEDDRVSLQNARNDYEKMLYANADFSTGRSSLGDYFLRNKDLKNAIKHYNISIQKDSLLFPVYTNLATAYSMSSNNQKALETLAKLIELNPQNSRAFYLRALLYYELKENEKAIADFKKAVEINPNDSRSYYNLATFYFQEKQLSEAEKYVNKALKIEPQNRDFKYLLALIYRDQGKFKSGQMIMQELRKLQ